MIIITSLMLALYSINRFATGDNLNRNTIFIGLIIVVVINIIYLFKGKNLKFLLKTVSNWINTYDQNLEDLKRVVLITRKIFILNIKLILLLPGILIILTPIGFNYFIVLSIIKSIILINGLIVGPVNLIADRSIKKMKCISNI